MRWILSLGYTCNSVSLNQHNKEMFHKYCTFFSCCSSSSCFFVCVQEEQHAVRGDCSSTCLRLPHSWRTQGHCPWKRWVFPSRAGNLSAIIQAQHESKAGTGWTIEDYVHTGRACDTVRPLETNNPKKDVYCIFSSVCISKAQGILKDI